MDKLDLQRGWGIDETTDYPAVVTEAHSAWSKGWVARIVDTDDHAPGGFVQLFLHDEKSGLSRAGNGWKEYRLVEPGLYQADSVYRSYTSFRTLFAFDGEKIQVLADTINGSLGHLKEVAKAWLQAQKAVAS